jgi:hypothetical protein
MEFVGFHFLFVLFVFCRFKDCRFPCSCLVAPLSRPLQVLNPFRSYRPQTVLLFYPSVLLHEGKHFVCHFFTFLSIHFDLICLVGLIPYFTIPHGFWNASSFFSFFRFGGGRGGGGTGGMGEFPLEILEKRIV